MKTKIAASLLSADFGHIADEVKRIEDSGADYLHLDVMDGLFVDNITMGPAMVAAVRKNTATLFLDVHLMIYTPFEYVEKFVESGANGITFHFEATEDISDTLEYIQRCNVKAGLAFRPETSFTFIPKYLDKCDMILLMTVNPGHGGQQFMPEVLEKIALTRESCDKLGIEMDIEVDGGINPKTAHECAQAGANVFVAGHYLFKEAPSLKEGVSLLRKASEKKR